MKVSDVKVFGIIGAGQMGAGIAQVAAAKGYKVLLLDVSKDLVEKSKGKLGAVLQKQVDKGKMTADDRATLLANIEPVDNATAFAKADIVVEAATENTDIKLKLFRAADEVMPKGAILASNTSSISITKLAASTSRPDKVIGMHFMNPVPLMKLIEIVRGLQTSDDTYALVKALSEVLGKVVITSNDEPGFIVNRMLIPFLNEACFGLQEGLGTIEDIDKGAKLGLNHPMGPLELADLVGLDTLLFIADVLHREFGEDKYRPATLLRNMVAAGWLGRKSGKGFYTYQGADKVPTMLTR
ncbi:MAG: 3-hydroxybutyryl-CoA dehydrogenase [Polyangiaceae bacterium]|jgi:3-hydroxybutyryl-CoA dehydrogenase|nr:3-hydroxybutyryl-CoA dehydrogenase [Polyangiaceae bacterium]